MVHIQRSRGYTQRNAFDLDTIQKVADTARKANPDVVIFVDNCYGEFTQIREPLSAGADVSRAALSRTPAAALPPLAAILPVKPTWWKKSATALPPPASARTWLHAGQPA